MAKCPFAEQKPISGTSGAYVAGPFRIVHHTTEGSSAAGAMAAYQAKRADPHFTVEGANIFQHIDTGTAARALRNADGGVQTNRHSAIQIEVVGFAGKAKSRMTLTSLARLCRWIEKTHDVPRNWPSGPPKPATAAGGDPGGHNRSAVIWAGKGGHYGHSQVPENTHWDPAYSKVEADFLMAAEFGADGLLSNASDPIVKALLDRPAQPAFADAPVEVMEDHFDVGESDD